MKKFALAMIATSAAVFGFGLVADAYPPGAGVVTATPASGAPGYDVAVTATCLPGEGVTFAVVTSGGSTASTTCSAAGTASATVKAPSAAGTYSVTATGTVTGALGSSNITVTAAGPGLPATGSDGISSMTIIALGLFGVGAGLFAVSQVRRRQTFA